MTYSYTTMTLIGTIFTLLWHIHYQFIEFLVSQISSKFLDLSTRNFMSYLFIVTYLYVLFLPFITCFYYFSSLSCISIYLYLIKCYLLWLNLYGRVLIAIIFTLMFYIVLNYSEEFKWFHGRVVYVPHD